MILEINNLKYKDLINDLTIGVRENEWVSVLGNSGSGKTLITKAISGIIPFEGEIKIDNVILDPKNSKDLYKEVAILFENPDSLFFSDSVYDELAYPMKKKKMKKSEIKEEIEKVSTLLGLNNLLKSKLASLSGSEKQMVALASAITKKPELIVIDDALSRLSTSEKKEVIKILKDMELALIYFSSNGLIAPHSDRIIIMDNGSVVSEGSKEEILKDDKLFNKLGITPPFMVDLSNKLSYYELTDEIIYDMEEMVDKLWK